MSNGKKKNRMRIHPKEDEEGLVNGAFEMNGVNDERNSSK